MKVSNNILKALIIGVAMAGTASSCEKVEIKDELGVHECNEECAEGECILIPDPGYPDNCPMCGLG